MCKGTGEPLLVQSWNVGEMDCVDGCKTAEESRKWDWGLKTWWKTWQGGFASGEDEQNCLKAEGKKKTEQGCGEEAWEATE